MNSLKLGAFLVSVMSLPTIILADDPLPPAAPTNLIAVAASGSQINLSFTDNSNNELNFKIERKTGNAPFQEITSLSPDATTFQNTGLIWNTAYVYRVKATNAIGASAYSNDASATTTNEPPYNEEQILRTINRIGFLDDSETIKLGLKYLEQMLVKMDLSAREDLRKALLSVITSDPDIVKTVTAEARKLAAQSLGHAKQVNASSAELNLVLKTKFPEPAQEAIVSHANTMKAMPSIDIVTTLKDLHMIDTLVSAALGCGDKETITYLVGIAQAEHRMEILYGLSGLDAAALVVTHYLDQLNVPAAPSGLVATAKTSTIIQLDWVDNSTNEENFLIERSDTVIDGPYKEIARVSGNQIHYLDSGLKEKSTYFYHVKALNVANNTGSAFTEPASATTPEAPTTQPDPAPKPPELPTSPPPAIPYADLTKKLVVYIEKAPHAGTLNALGTILNKGRSEVAVNAGNVLTEKFDRAAFDFNAMTTSLGLKAVADLKTRAKLEQNNMSIPPHLRTAYSVSLNANARALQDRFLANPVNPIRAMVGVFQMMAEE